MAAALACWRVTRSMLPAGGRRAFRGGRSRGAARRCRPTGDRLAILTNGGGAGVLASDALDAAGGRLASLSRDTIARLDRALPRTWSRGNPVDIIGDAPGGRYAEALEALLADPEIDAILVLNCPTALAASDEAARAVIDTLAAAATAQNPRNVF